MVDPGVEVGEVADPRRQMHCAVGRPRQQQRLHALDLPPLRPIGMEQLRQPRPQGGARTGAKREQRIEPLPAGRVRCPLRLAGEHARLAGHLEVEDVVPDRDAAARPLPCLAVDAERQVLDREIRMAVGAFDPAPALHVMGCVDHPLIALDRSSKGRTARRISFAPASG